MSTQEPTDELEKLRREVIKIVDEKRSRYLVSVAIAEFIQARESAVREEAYKQGHIELAENIVSVLNDLASTITDGHKPTISS